MQIMHLRIEHNKYYKIMLFFFNRLTIKELMIILLNSLLKQSELIAYFFQIISNNKVILERGQKNLFSSLIPLKSWLKTSKYDSLNLYFLHRSVGCCWYLVYVLYFEIVFNLKI